LNPSHQHLNIIKEVNDLPSTGHPNDLSGKSRLNPSQQHPYKTLPLLLR
jgi:hypothetical protein